MNSETVSMLCNPYTHESLRYIKTQESDGTIKEFLEGVETGERFPIKNGIPVLYDESRLQGLNLRYQKFYRSVAKYYDFALRTIGFLSGGSESKFRNQYLQQLEIQKDSRVLEVSVGTGANLALLPPLTRTYGLDLSWEMLLQCQKSISRFTHNVELFFGNAEELPFRDAMFDVVFHVGGINAFSNRSKAITEMIRIARPGTKIVVVDETAKMMKALSWMPSARKMVEEWGDRFEAPVNLVPSEMKELQVNTIVNGFFYVLSFRTP